MSSSQPTKKNNRRAIRSLAVFAREEDGSLLVFSMFMLLIMMLATGVAFDVIRMEVTRTKLQSTLDRAVLAAADLDQTLQPKDVVTDYFNRAGLAGFIKPDDVKVTEGLNYRTVSADSKALVNTQFMRMVGIDTLDAVAAGTADERITDVEISLVLDNSGSMGWDDDYRLDLLKDAAKDFIDIVIPDEGEGVHDVSINIIPFATQVSAGEDLLDYFDVSDEHGYSHCVDFSSDDFNSAAITTSQDLQRTGHFAPWGYSSPPAEGDLVCPTEASRSITVMGHDKEALKDKIDDMWAGGNTSIDIGTKWGLALLDPAFRPIANDMNDKGKIVEGFEGRPFDYSEGQVLKVLIVMSDGENTTQYMLDEDYRDGLSRYYEDNVNGRETWYHNRGGTSYDYYYDYGNEWRNQPYLNWGRAEQFTWPELWAARSVRHFGYYTLREIYGNASDDFLSEFTDTVSPSTKNTRTSEICATAKAQGITVYTVGMETYGQGDATLSDCASAPAFFLDVAATEIDEAFSAIARDISRLRLLH